MEELRWGLCSRSSPSSDVPRNAALPDGRCSAARRYNWIVYAYVLMTNHTHLVIESPSGPLTLFNPLSSSAPGIKGVACLNRRQRSLRILARTDLPRSIESGTKDRRRMRVNPLLRERDPGR
jgi:hypothetical protein